jgi:hypothetical protein
VSEAWTVGNPQNASLNADGFRFYSWIDPITDVETKVLSVTSIRKLVGESYNLVRWQIANVMDAALGTRKRTVIGPRGGVSEKRLIEDYPSEFAQLYDAAKGDQSKVDEVRKWLREQAEEPRNLGAIRGTVVHESIEKNVSYDRVERPYVEMMYANLSAKDRAKAKKGVQDEDVYFVRNAMRQYWAMRRHPEIRFVIIAREVQVFNLTAGYAGSFDALVWMVPEGWTGPLPKANEITLDWIRKHGGYLCLLDWKTSKDVYTDQVVQLHAYLSAEFVGSDGIIDNRMTDLLLATKRAALVHIRPNKWGFHEFEYSDFVTYAFLGSVAFARFLAAYPHPSVLFTRDLTGSAPEEELVDVSAG